jgi:hypothetical protein
MAKEIIAKVSRIELISDLRTGKSTNINGLAVSKLTPKS